MVQSEISQTQREGPYIIAYMWDLQKPNLCKRGGMKWWLARPRGLYKWRVIDQKAQTYD